MTGKICKKFFLDFIGNGKRDGNLMARARIQPFCIALNIDIINYFNGKEVYFRSVTERNKALISCKKPFCLIWESNGVSFNEALEELKTKFTKANNYMSFDNVNSFFQNYHKPKKIDPQLIIFIVYNLETFHRDRVVQFCATLCRFRKIASKDNRGLTNEEYQKLKKGASVFDWTNRIRKLLGWLVTLKGEPREVKRDCWV